MAVQIVVLYYGLHSPSDVPLLYSRGLSICNLTSVCHSCRNSRPSASFPHSSPILTLLWVQICLWVARFSQTAQSYAYRQVLTLFSLGDDWDCLSRSWLCFSSWCLFFSLQCFPLPTIQRPCPCLRKTHPLCRASQKVNHGISREVCSPTRGSFRRVQKTALPSARGLLMALSSEAEASLGRPGQRMPALIIYAFF